MPRLTQVLRQCNRAVEDVKLLKVLQSEIEYEFSANPTKNAKRVNFGDFKVEWDDLQSQDVVLRRKFESGEEVAISALLVESFGKDILDYSSDYLMKGCVKKPGLTSVLQFDCGVSERGNSGTWFNIKNAHYLPSTSACPKFSACLGPSFSSKSKARKRRAALLLGCVHFGSETLKEYPIALGISKSLTDFLLIHLRHKEQDQYVKWLQKIKSLVEQGDQQTN